MAHHSSRGTINLYRRISFVLLFLGIGIAGLGVFLRRPHEPSRNETTTIARGETLALPPAEERADFPTASAPLNAKPAERRKTALEKSKGRVDWRAYLRQFDLPNEIVGRRDAHARHYRNADGTVTALLSPSAIHYRDERGAWLPIDPAILPAGDRFANETNTLKSSFPKDAADHQGTTIGLGEDRSYSWTPVSIGYHDATGRFVPLSRTRSAAAEVDEEEISYPGIFPASTDRYRVRAGMVKHDLLLQVPPALPKDAETFDYVGHVRLGEDLLFEVEGDRGEERFVTSSSIWVVTRAGERLFRIGIPLAREESGSAKVVGRYDVRPIGERVFEMKIQVPATWLRDPKRSYPVAIDPTTWEANGVRVDNSYFYEEWWVDDDYYWSSWGNTQTGDYGADGSYGGSAWYDCAIGNDYDWVNEYYRSAVDWDTSSIPDGATVLNTEVRIYVPGSNYGDFDSGNTYVHAYNMESDWYNRTNAHWHWNDCGNGALYLSWTYLYQGQGYTSYLDLGSSADSTVQSQLGSNWFGMGFIPASSGDQGVIAWLDLSPLRVTYNTKPSAPNLASPSNGVRTVGNSVAFQWSASTDPEGDSLTYYLYVGTTNPPTTLLATTTQTSYSGFGASDATTYYWRVRAWDGSVFSDYSATRWFRENGTPAVPSAVSPPNGGWTSASSVAVQWSSGSDPDGDAVTYEWEVATTNPPSPPNVSSGATSGTTSSSFSTSNGATYYWRVRAWDGYEYGPYSSVFSFGVDATAPSSAGAVVNDGAGADVDWQNSTTSIQANWSGFTDAESGVASYDWAIGTAANPTSVLNWTNVGNVTTATASGLSLAEGATYVVSVRARDQANNASPSVASDGVKVDQTPPTLGTVKDGSGADIDWQTNNNSISANWSGSDTLSGIDHYDWAIGTAGNPTSVQTWTSTGTSTNATANGLSLNDGTTYIVTVRAYDKAGNLAQGSSDGVTVDSTGPAPGTVNDGNTPGADIDFQSTTDAIHANWSGFADALNAIASYQWAIGTTPGATNIQDWTSAGISGTQATKSGLSLADGTYYVSVRGIDSLGNVGAPGISDGVLVDTTGPSPGAVNDGSGADIDYQNSTTAIQANWSGFTDAGGIATYQWAIGTTPGGTEVLDWTAVGNVLGATKTGLSLAEGTTYYVSVRAVDNAGLTGPAATSDGVTIDTTPPEAPVLQSPADGATTGPSPLLQWSGSGATYQVEIDGVSTTVTGAAYQPVLADGAHTWRVRAFDEAGNASPWSASRSLTVDAVAPTTPMPIAPAQGAALSVNPTEFTWTASTDSSGVGHYELEVSSGGALLYQASPTGESQTANLPDGSFAWRVRAVDLYGNVGSWSVTTNFTKSSGLDPTAPTAPELVAPEDGVSIENPVNFVWTAATDDGGIEYYRVQVDTESGFAAPIYLDATTSSLTLSAPTLAPGSYFWRVRALDVDGNAGPWSEVRTFTIPGTAGGPPGVPTLLWPLNNFVLPPGSIILNWTDVSGATAYEMELYQSGAPLFVDTPIGSWSVTPALAPGTYAWRARAIGPGGTGEWTPFWNFTMVVGAPIDSTAPTAPVQISPPDTAVVSDPAVDLSWTPGTDPQSGIAYHLVEVLDAGNNTIFTAEVAAGNTLETPVLGNGSYRWRVAAVNGQGGATSTAADFSFVVDTSLDVMPPSVVALLSPPNGAKQAPGEIQFLWYSATDDAVVAYYEFQLDTEAAFETPVTWTLQLNATGVAILLGGGNYFWRVRAIDSAGNVGPWSAAWSFEVQGVVKSSFGGSVGGCGGSVASAGPSLLLAFLGLVLLLILSWLPERRG